jgi:hypothetical protein
VGLEQLSVYAGAEEVGVKLNDWLTLVKRKVE